MQHIHVCCKLDSNVDQPIKRNRSTCSVTAQPPRASTGGFRPVTLTAAPLPPATRLYVKCALQRVVTLSNFVASQLSHDASDRPLS